MWWMPSNFMAFSVSYPDVANDRLIAPVAARGLRPGLAALLAALGEDQPAGPEPAVERARERLGTRLVAREVRGHRMQALGERRLPAQHAAEQRRRADAGLGERARDEVARTVEHAGEMVERGREALALLGGGGGQRAEPVAARARLD